MPSIQSIICFNGGSAGDFLKLACNQQIDPNFDYTLSKLGMVELSHNFKDFTNAVFNKTKTWDDIASVDVDQIDNTHFYLDEFKTLAKHLFYIDYPDSMNSTIVDLYATKRVRNHSVLTQRVKLTLPLPLQRYVNESNAKEICQVRWKRNLETWRNNPDLAAIQLKDFFNFEKLSDIVACVSGQTKLDLTKLQVLHSAWVEKNSQMQLKFEQIVH